MDHILAVRFPTDVDVRNSYLPGTRDPRPEMDFARELCRKLAIINMHPEPFGLPARITGIATPPDSCFIYAGSSNGRVGKLDSVLYERKDNEIHYTAGELGKVGSITDFGPWLIMGLFGRLHMIHRFKKEFYRFHLSDSRFLGLVTSLLAFKEVDKSQILYICAGDEMGTVVLWTWNLEEKNVQQEVVVKKHTDAVSSIVQGPDLIFTASEDSSICAWGSNLVLKYKLTEPKSGITSILFYESTLVSASFDGSICTWEDKREQLGTISSTSKPKFVHKEPLNSAVTGMGLVDDVNGNPILIICFENNDIILYEFKKFPKEIKRVSHSSAAVVVKAAGQSRRSIFYTGHRDGTVVAWHVYSRTDYSVE